MRKIIALLAICCGPLGPSLVYGQNYEPFSQWKIDASFPLQYGTNSLLTPTNSLSDIFVSPSMKLSALGDLNATTSYSIYAGGGPDAFARVHAANDGLLTIGGTLQKQFGRFVVGPIYEHVLAYDGVFRLLAYQADDFSGYAGYVYKDKAAGFSATPSFLATYRAADVAAAGRVLYTLKAEILQKLDANWAVFVTPRFRYYIFTADTGPSSGRQDVRPSVVAGLTYSFNADVSITGSVEYDRLWSNMPANNFTNTVFLVSLDFSHTYDRVPSKK